MQYNLITWLWIYNNVDHENFIKLSPTWHFKLFPESFNNIFLSIWWKGNLKYCMYVTNIIYTSNRTFTETPPVLCPIYFFSIPSVFIASSFVFIHGPLISSVLFTSCIYYDSLKLYFSYLSPENVASFSSSSLFSTLSQKTGSEGLLYSRFFVFKTFFIEKFTPPHFLFPPINALTLE